MIRALSFILLVIVLSCTPKRRLAVNDLKFPDLERQSLAKGFIDTAFLVSTNWSLRDGRDTIGAICYDSSGRVIADHSNKWESFKYSYDSSGLPNYRFYRDFDVQLEFRPTYRFDLDSLVLYQTWTGGYPYTCKFVFDSDGYLLQELSNDPDNLSGTRKSIKTYHYNDDKKLIKETEIIQKDGRLKSEKITSFFYSKDGTVDSAYSNINSVDEGQFKVVTYYNDLGLRSQTIMQDTLLIKYIHHKRSGT